ncbi:MAG: hypothetical protein M3N52_07015 [Actinomycetota bacterium]|nr:hypothetical protein [Actinomycetota bacterium]
MDDLSTIAVAIPLIGATGLLAVAPVFSWRARHLSAIADREALADDLRAIAGVQPFPSATNFLLVRLPVGDAQGVVADLAARGVHVRYFGNPAHGITDCLRVTIGTPEENRIFLDELADALGNGAATS